MIVAVGFDDDGDLALRLSVALDNVLGLANRDGVLYAVMKTGEVLTISPSTGIATLKGDNGLVQAGLAVAP